MYRAINSIFLEVLPFWYTLENIVSFLLASCLISPAPSLALDSALLFPSILATASSITLRRGRAGKPLKHQKVVLEGTGTWNIHYITYTITTMKYKELKQFRNLKNGQRKKSVVRVTTTLKVTPLRVPTETDPTIPKHDISPIPFPWTFLSDLQVSENPTFLKSWENNLPVAKQKRWPNKKQQCHLCQHEKKTNGVLAPGWCPTHSTPRRFPRPHFQLVTWTTCSSKIHGKRTSTLLIY